MVLSDLHYTEKQDQDHTLVSGIAEAERITDALIAEVIDRHPDVRTMDESDGRNDTVHCQKTGN